MDCKCPKCGTTWRVDADDKECECFGVEVEGEESYVVGCGYVFSTENCKELEE